MTAAAQPALAVSAPRAIAAARPRVLAVDVLRGLVLVFLLPDLAGGFSFYAMAARHPDHWAWAPLAAQFTHVEWIGVALWDLVMPLFVFVVGVSMALSYAARRSAGEGEGGLLAHAAIRAAALVSLGLLLQMRWDTRIDELMPYFVLSLGLPIGLWVAGSSDPRKAQVVGNAYAAAVLLISAVWLAANYRRLDNYDLTQILVLIGLAYMPAFLMQRFGLAAQAAVAIALVAAHGLVFWLYEPSTALRWSNGSNAAAAFDRWLLNLLPRAAPYATNPHGYHTLQVVPLIGLMLAGAIAGRLLASRGPSRRLAGNLAAAAAAGLVLSALLSLGVSPLLKSLWTPTWTIFSAAVCVLLLAAALWLTDRPRRPRWALPLVVLGSNSILLYVLAYTERWRLAALWQGVFGAERVAAIDAWPVLESCLVLASWWLLAWVLYRLRFFVRL